MSNLYAVVRWERARQTAFPEFGKRYELADKRCVLCIDIHQTLIETYYVFCHLEAEPYIVMAGAALAATPVWELTETVVVPARRPGRVAVGVAQAQARLRARLAARDYGLVP